MAILQFGNKIDGVHYNQRPGVYAVIINDNKKCALVKEKGKYHLPGGGIKKDEKIDDALKREVLEETGLVFNKARRVGNANQYCYASDNEKYYNKLCHYFLITNFHNDKSAKAVEYDIHWTDLTEAAKLLDHGSHAWAVKEAKKIMPLIAVDLEIKKMIQLQPFNESDMIPLINEIPDARFLLQWAGPKYTYPLDADQIGDTLSNTHGEQPSFKVFKAVQPDSSETAGHIQLMNIDYNTATCVLGRVLIFQKYRGNGFGKSMVRAAVTFAFENLHLAEVTLSVFDFNTPAINTYLRLGFSEYQFNKGARQFKNESWNVIKMKLCKKKT